MMSVTGTRRATGMVVLAGVEGSARASTPVRILMRPFGFNYLTYLAQRHLLTAVSLCHFG